MWICSGLCGDALDNVRRLCVRGKSAEGGGLRYSVELRLQAIPRKTIKTQHTASTRQVMLILTVQRHKGLGQQRNHPELIRMQARLDRL